MSESDDQGRLTNGQDPQEARRRARRRLWIEVTIWVLGLAFLLWFWFLSGCCAHLLQWPD